MESSSESGNNPLGNQDHRQEKKTDGVPFGRELLFDQLTSQTSHRLYDGTLPLKSQLSRVRKLLVIQLFPVHVALRGLGVGCPPRPSHRFQVRLDRLPSTGQQPHGRRVLSIKHGLDPAEMNRGTGEGAGLGADNQIMKLANAIETLLVLPADFVARRP